MAREALCGLGLSLRVGGEKRDFVSSGLWENLANFLAHFSPADLILFFPTLNFPLVLISSLTCFLPCIMCIFCKPPQSLSGRKQI